MSEPWSTTLSLRQSSRWFYCRSAWLLLTGCFVLGAITLSVHAGDGSVSATCTLPRQLTIPQYSEFMSSNPSYVVTRLFPMGWSKRGRFAWIVSQFQDSVGQITISFQVINTINDRMLEGITVDYPAHRTEEQEGALAAFWESKRKQVCTTLARHGISQQQISLAQFPYNRQGDKIDAYTKPDSPAQDTKQLSLMCRSQKRGEKQIATLQRLGRPVDQTERGRQ